MENQKWKNLDAGRIQVKRVNAAYARLMTEHNRKIEINGVHGGTESRCVIYSPFSREVRRNHAQNGIEIVFPQRPEQGIIDALKRVGFRWSRSRGLWYNRFSAEAWETACKIVGAESDASFSP